MRYSISAICLLIIVSIFIGMAAASSDNLDASDKPAPEYINKTIKVYADSPAFGAPGSAKALLIQDRLPWGLNSNAMALNAHGVAYDVISSADLAATDISGYGFIMYSSFQPHSYYANITADLAKIKAYIAAGGFLIAHSCDLWDWTGLEILPAGVIIGYQFDPRNNIHITNPDHPVTKGLTDVELSNWDASTHGYFTNLPPGTDVLMVTDSNLPTFIDYSYGRGRVIASMQTIEWQYAGMIKGVMLTEFLSNEINYALAFAIPSENDLEVSKEAQVNGIAVQQVNPGQIFNYNITVANKDLFDDAPLVVVTDKLPYDVEYLGADVYPAAPQDYTINQSGDLVYVRFDQIPAASTRYINITVRAPTNAPATLYNIVNLRYRNDQNQSNNRMTLVTYVPQLGYNQTLAAFSFEDLLHNQSQLLFQFENLLHTIPSNSSTNYTFLVSFEQLLRSQAALTSSFEDLLSNESSTGWDGEYRERTGQRCSGAMSRCY